MDNLHFQRQLASAAVFLFVSATGCGRLTQAQKDSTSQQAARQIASVIAGPKVFQATPATVVGIFRPIVELKAGEATQDVWHFTGTNPEIGVKWVQVEFQPGQKEKWDLLQIRLGVAPRDKDYDGFLESLVAEIRRRLGPPAYDEHDAADRREFWHVGKYCELSLRRAIAENPMNKQTGTVILIEAAILQGEAE